MNSKMETFKAGTRLVALLFVEDLSMFGFLRYVPVLAMENLLLVIVKRNLYVISMRMRLTYEVYDTSERLEGNIQTY